MIVYFANRRMDILGTANTSLPSGHAILDDLKSEDVDTGVATFSCTIGFSEDSRKAVEEMCEAGNYILRSTSEENEFYTIIDETIDTKAQTINVYAEDAGLDLINEVVGAYAATEAHNIEWYIDKYLADTGFRINVNEVGTTKTRTLSWDGEATVTTRLASIATQFDNAEISFSFDMDGLVIASKYINIYKERGKDVQDKLRLNKEIDKITVKKSVANVATALSCTGGTPEGSSTAITLKGYTYDDGDIYVDSTGLLKSRSALKKWSRYLFQGDPLKTSGGFFGDVVRTYTYDTTSQQTLCAHAVTELKKIYDTEINYTIDLVDLPDGIKIGDRVDIVDEKGEIFVSSRILKLETSLTSESRSATLGEYLIKDSGISYQVEQMASDFAKAAASRTLYTWFAYADDASGTGITIDPTGKAYLGTAANKDTSTVDISDPAVFTWAKIQGDGGEGGVTMTITSSQGTLFKSSKIVTVLTAHVYKDGAELTTTEIAALGEINWYEGGTKIWTGNTLTYTAADNKDEASLVILLEG